MHSEAFTFRTTVRNHLLVLDFHSETIRFMGRLHFEYEFPLSKSLTIHN